MVADIPVDEVHVLSTYVESILYGVFFVMYLGCVWVLVKRSDPSRSINKPMLLVATAMMVIATLFEAVSIQRDVEAFFEHKDGSPVVYYKFSSNWPNLYQTTLWNVQILMGDAILVYRMYVVYNRRLWIVVLPILLWFANIVCGINIIREFSLLDAMENSSYFNQRFVSAGAISLVISLTFDSDILWTQNIWATSAYSVTIAQNAISTVAIAVRLWWLGRGMGKWFGGRYWASVTIFLESGLPYTLALATLTVLHVQGRNAYDFAYYGIVPITGISFTGLIIRVGLRTRTEVIGTSMPGVEPTYPHKIKTHNISGMPTFASPPTQTQGTIVSTVTDFSTHEGTVPNPILDLEKAQLPPLRGSHVD